MSTTPLKRRRGATGKTAAGGLCSLRRGLTCMIFGGAVVLIVELTSLMRMDASSATKGDAVATTIARDTGLLRGNSHSGLSLTEAHMKDRIDQQRLLQNEKMNLRIQQHLEHPRGGVDPHRIPPKPHPKQQEQPLQSEKLQKLLKQLTPPANEEDPKKPFPYLVDPPPADYDIHTSWNPLGGYRFGEYSGGASPYVVDDPAVQEHSDNLARARRTFVKKAMQTAWKGYVEHAFGWDEIQPISAKGSANWGGFGVTLVDSLDTLWLMDMKEEFYKARDWVRDSLNHDKPHSVSVFETTIRSLGGLLSAFDWSGDRVFLDKALDLAQRLIKAYHSRTGLPYGMVNLATGATTNLAWANGNVILSEVGSVQLEFRWLDEFMNHTPETQVMRQKTEHVFEILRQVSPPNGLYPYYLSNYEPDERGLPPFRNEHLTFGAMADSFYEYILKIWIQGGKVESFYREMYDKAMDGMHKELLTVSKPSGLTYIADKMDNHGKMDYKMDHLVCFMGGLLALGAYTDPLGMDSERAKRDLKTAKALTYTCYQMYARMETGIAPEYIQFPKENDFVPGGGGAHYLLRPETVESFFILNQLTKDPIYREWGWEVFQSIEKYCRVGVGYGTLSNVNNPQGTPRDKTESFFLAETLKYLYLLLDPDTEVDVLNKHVFNTEAHPMKIFPVLNNAKQQ